MKVGFKRIKKDNRAERKKVTASRAALPKVTQREPNLASRLY
jgi:hypothetical protein